FSRSRRPRTTDFSAVELRIVVRNGDGLFDQIRFVCFPTARTRDPRRLPPRVLFTGIDRDELFDHIGFGGIVAEWTALRIGHDRSPPASEQRVRKSTIVRFATSALDAGPPPLPARQASRRLRPGPDTRWRRGPCSTTAPHTAASRQPSGPQ